MLDSAHITKFFTALGDPVRLQIVTLLRAKPLNVGEIAQQFQLSRPAISHHLRVLKEAEIVESQKAGQEVYYALKTEHIVYLLRAMADKLEGQSEGK